MPSSPASRPSPDLPPGPRAALVIATTEYADPDLVPLTAPAQDARAVTEVLGDPAIGGFTVTQVLDADERDTRRTIAALLSSRGAADVVLVYLSCHGSPTGEGGCTSRLLAAIQGERYRGSGVVAGERVFGGGSGCGGVACDDTVSVSDRAGPPRFLFPKPRGGP